MLDRFDQAQGLRELFARPRLRVLPVLASEAPEVAPFVVAIAAAMARSGLRPLVLDADRGRIVSIAGLRPRHELLHLLAGDCEPRDALCADPRGFSVLQAARGLDALAPGEDVRRLFAAFGRLQPAFDVAIVVAPAARLARVLGADIEPLTLAATDLASAQAAYARLRDARVAQGLARARIVWRASAAAGAPAADVAHARMAAATARALGVRLAHGGAFAGARDRAGLERVAALAFDAAAALPARAASGQPGVPARAASGASGMSGVSTAPGAPPRRAATAMPALAAAG